MTPKSTKMEFDVKVIIAQSWKEVAVKINDGWIATTNFSQVLDMIQVELKILCWKKL